MQVLKLDINDNSYEINNISLDTSNLGVEYEILPYPEFLGAGTIDSIEREQSLIDDKIESLNSEIERLTNDADSIDYIVSACSGVVAGLVDSFFVGEWNLDIASAHKKVNEFIMDYAKRKGYKGDRLNGAINFLESKFPVAQDNIWKGKGISSTILHHLEDIAHHPTIAGLIAAIVVAFFRTAFFVDKDGSWHAVFVPGDGENSVASELAKVWSPIVISGVLRWLVYVAESKYVEKEGHDIPKPIRKIIIALSYSPAVIQILKVSANWFGHLVSDMGGSKNTPGRGTGVAGVFLALLKEISSIPPLNLTGLPKLVSDIYSKKGFDMRHEIAALEMLGKQTIPIIVNESIVRTFYFVRHLLIEKENKEWSAVNWSKVVPWGNRTIVRMITISSGVFCAFDITDAAIRSAIKNGGNIYNPKLYTDFVLRLNFVGIGRFCLAVGADIGMGVKRSKVIQERQHVMNQWLMLQNAKIYSCQAGMWKEAADAEAAIEELHKAAEIAVNSLNQSIIEADCQMVGVRTCLSELDDDDCGELLNELNF